MSRLLSNNLGSFNTTNISITTGDDRPNILAWLSPLDPRLRHQDIRDRRVENVGQWILQTEEFRRWYTGSGEDESDNAVLFCYGDPGVGKTYISSLVIDSLCDQAGRQDATIACFYFDFAAQKEQSLTNIMGALVKQLVCGVEEMPEEISRAFQDQKNSIGGRGPHLSGIVEMMQNISSKKRTFICIDALDECAAGYRVKLLDSLNQILGKSPGARIFVTGRGFIRPEIGKCLSGKVTNVSISPRRDDIIDYLRTKLHEDTILDAMDRSLEAEILKKIPDDISEIFLLVSLNIDAILQETTIHSRRQKLDAMTNGSGLGEAYGATLGRIKGQGGGKARLGMATLMWVSHAERPLEPDELCQALAVEIGSANLNTDNVPSIGTLLACCQGLIVMDKEASTVRLIHFTLQEYLQAHPELFGTPHSTMTETCLSYLNSQHVIALSAHPSPDPRGTPFLEYSSLYWGMHAKRELSDSAKLLALKLFDDNNHICARILLKSQRPYSPAVGFGISARFTGLHFASNFGIVELLDVLINVGGCDINQRDLVGNTPLLLAAENGHDGVVEVLLGRGDVDPDGPDWYSRTPLSWAARRGHEGVVKMLLRRDDVNPDKPDRYGRTPLFRAAQGGFEGVVKILLERRDVNSDRPDYSGQTPLCHAAENGHEGVVILLVGRDGVNCNRLDRFKRTPLCSAARNGDEEVVKILLGRDDVNPDGESKYEQAPLLAAATYGHEGVVKMLLGREDVNPDKPDRYGRTPLFSAAQGGFEGVVKILLGRAGVDPSKPDNNCQTPLFIAAACGHAEVVKILLGPGHINPDRADNNGQTPLFISSLYGHEGVVKILLGQGGVNPDKPDNGGRTPLSCAAWNGHEEVVKMLLGRDSVNPNKPDNNGHTPLWWAGKRSHMGAVALLQKSAGLT